MQITLGNCSPFSTMGREDTLQVRPIHRASGQEIRQGPRVHHGTIHRQTKIADSAGNGRKGPAISRIPTYATSISAGSARTAAPVPPLFPPLPPSDPPLKSTLSRFASWAL